MAMGYGASVAMVINEEDVKKLIPDEFNDLSNAIENHEVTFQCLAVAYQREEAIDDVSEEASKEILSLWEKAQAAFQERTQLSLFINYHNSEEEGDRYDGVQGLFFTLDIFEVLDYTPAARKLKDQGIHAELTQWVTIG